MHHFNTLELYQNVSSMLVEMTGVEPASKQDFPVSPTVYPEIESRFPRISGSPQGIQHFMLVACRGNATLQATSI